jgi:uncharacterized protein
MKQRMKTLFAGGVLALALFGVAAADPFEDGRAAAGRGDYATAIQLWRPLADNSDAKAQTALGNAYLSGQGVPQDYTQAVAWLRKGADQGDAGAELLLGGMYANGRGVPQDYAQAAAWYRKTADQGNAAAQFGLGVIYEAGDQGVPQDYAQAHMWYNLAASHADDAKLRDRATSFRDSLATIMTPAQIAEAQRQAREWVPKVNP